MVYAEDNDEPYDAQDNPIAKFPQRPKPPKPYDAANTVPIVKKHDVGIPDVGLYGEPVPDAVPDTAQSEYYTKQSASYSYPLGDYVTRSNALMYGKACKEHANAWTTAMCGIFLLGFLLGPISIVRTFSARSKAKKSGVAKVGIGPAILGIFVTIWGVFIMWTLYTFFTTTLPTWEQQIQNKMSTSQLVPNQEGTPTNVEELLKMLQQQKT